MHEREQLCINDLFIDVNKPLTINNTLEGRWISISWHRKVDPNGNIGFYAFDVGVISSILQNKVQISFWEEDKKYTVPLKCNNWTKCVNFPPSRQYQWQSLSKKASLSYQKSNNCKYSLKLISYLQSDVVLQHEIHQLQEYDLIVDVAKTILDNSLIGRWISISWHRQIETLDFNAFDVGMVNDVKDGKVFVDYKDEAVHATPLKSSGWNCLTTDIPRRQHRWHMLKRDASATCNKAQEPKPMTGFEWKCFLCSYSNEDDMSRDVFEDTNEGR